MCLAAAAQVPRELTHGLAAAVEELEHVEALAEGHRELELARGTAEPRVLADRRRGGARGGRVLAAAQVPRAAARAAQVRLEQVLAEGRPCSPIAPRWCCCAETLRGAGAIARFTSSAAAATAGALGERELGALCAVEVAANRPPRRDAWRARTTAAASGDGAALAPSPGCLPRRGPRRETRALSAGVIVGYPERC